GGDPRVAELRDLLREEAAARVLVALVPAPSRLAVELLRESRDVGRIRQVRRAGDEQGPAILLLGVRVDPRPPGPQGGTVRMFFARLLEERRRVGLEVEDRRVGED